MSSIPEALTSTSMIVRTNDQEQPLDEPRIIDPLIAIRPLVNNLQQLDDKSEAFYKQAQKFGPIYFLQKIIDGQSCKDPSCIAKTGVLSNIVAVIGAVTRSPLLLLGGLVVSSTILVINFEEEQQKEILRNLIKELQLTNASLTQSNVSLRTEVERLKACTEDLRFENERLAESTVNLQSKIDILNNHIIHLERCNTLFEGHLSSLRLLLVDINKQKSPLRAPSFILEGMQHHLKKINEESLEFASFFITTQSLIGNKQELIKGQIAILTSTIEELVAKIANLSAVQGVDNIIEHLHVSLRGLRQFQQSLQSTENELIHLENKCKMQHQCLINSQHSCNELMTHITKNVVSTSLED